MGFDSSSSGSLISRGKLTHFEKMAIKLVKFQ